MADIESSIHHGEAAYAAEIVTIERTELGREDHGFFTAGLHVGLRGGAAGTMIGGFSLDTTPEEGVSGSCRRPTAYGLQWIIEAIHTVGGEYGKWEDLRGRQVFGLWDVNSSRYNRAGYNCLGLSSLDGQRVMIFSEVAAHAGEKVDASS